MADVIMYTSATCPYCTRAKTLLAQKNVAYKEIRIDEDPAQRDIMIEKSGRRTVPQIFINGTPVGGSDDLYALNKSGELDKLLEG